MKSIDNFIDFFLHEMGTSVLINGVSRTALLTDAPKGGLYYFNDLYIRTKEAVSTGDIVTHLGSDWLMLSQVAADPNSYQGRIRKCNHLTKFILEDWLYSFPSVIEMERLSIGSSGTLQIAEGSLVCTLRADEVTNSIAINQRFIASDAPWKVIGVDKTNPGLMILNTERALIASGDDMENEIANADTLPVWSIALQSAVETVPLDDDLTVTAVLYRNETAQESPSFLWSSADSSIASVADGVITGVAEGNTTITVRWTEHPSVLLTFPITVEENIPDVISYRFYCIPGDGSGKTYSNFDIFQGDTNIYGVEKYINDVLAETNDTYAFTFTPNGATSANYTYTVLTDTTVSIYNKLKYLTHTCTLSATSNQTSQSLQISILLKGAW